MTGTFLFSVDLEDVRDHVAGGAAWPSRVERNTRAYLRFLERHGIRATFFVVGAVAERHPTLIREIAAAGHELACHTHGHVPLDRQTPESLRADLERNLEALSRCGAGEVIGFRAPTFSLTEATRWAYGVLEELGFRYSTSVLPARNPLYGWPGFGAEPRRMGAVWELPLTMHRRLGVPLAGGVYFRVLPYFFIESGVRKQLARGEAVHSYFHPYDIDADQPPMAHADLGGNPLYDALMYVGRSRVLDRLERLAGICRFETYREYLAKIDG